MASLGLNALAILNEAYSLLKHTILAHPNCNKVTLEVTIKSGEPATFARKTYIFYKDSLYLTTSCFETNVCTWITLN